VKALAVAILLIASHAHADVFEFKDVDGFEKCLKLDSLVETVKTDKGAQTRVLNAIEIQTRCIDAGVKLLATSKNKDVLGAFIKAVKRLSAPENALELCGLLAGVATASCNDIDLYEVLIAGFAHVDDNYVERAKTLARRCLKDKNFQKDFLDETSNSDANVRAHACEVLLGEKLVKSCKPRKP
jgi:hypothetical protein